MSKSVYNKIVRVQTGNPLLNLNDLNDVNTSTAANGQILKYNGSAWVNSAESAAGVTSFNTRSGAVTLDENDLQPLANSYFKLFATFLTGTFIAEPNTVHSLFFGGTVQINPMAPGSHVIILATGNHINVTFTGASIVLNSYLAGSTINPTFSLLYCTIELLCVTNLGQTEWAITRISQNHPSSLCTLNGQKVSALGSFNNLPDVNINSPANGQVLTYSGGIFVNQDLPASVISFNSRTGAVLPASGDYNISQITNSSVLANSANINISGPVASQSLIYSGTQWANGFPYGFRAHVFLNSASITAELEKVYIGPNSTFTLPTTGLGDVGKRILFTTQGGSQVAVTIPSGVFVENLTNTSINSPYGALGIIVTSSNEWRIWCNTGGWVNSGKIIRALNIGEALDANINSPVNGQVLTYSAGKWINANVATPALPTSFITFNSRGNLTNATYLCQNGTVSGDIRLANVLMPRATTILFLAGQVNIASTTGAGWRFRLYKNGVDTGIFVEMLGTATSQRVTANVSYAQFDTLQVRIEQVGGATVPAGWATAEY